MYATCLWCQRSLGRNETIEPFPVGRRLAFDAAKGRLWVVCPTCERWNLTPLEERWEAIEACERLYRDTRTRVATDNVGLARVGDGLELVRIGAPLRPEFAAWRYGDQFGRRRRRAIVLGTGVGVAMTAVAVGQLAMGIGSFGLINLLRPIYNAYRRRRVVTHVQDPLGAILPVTPHAVALARATLQGDELRMALPRKGVFAQSTVSKDHDVFQLRDDADQGLKVPVSRLDLAEWHFFRGDIARSALARVMPHVNASGGGRSDIADGLRRIEMAGPDAAALLRQRTERHLPLGKAPPSLRLALEMALHEADERRWMEGELADLEARWKEAEALAAIADRLTVPDAVDDSLERLRRGERGTGDRSPSDSRS